MNSLLVIDFIEELKKQLSDIGFELFDDDVTINFDSKNRITPLLIIYSKVYKSDDTPGVFYVSCICEQIIGGKKKFKVELQFERIK